MKDVRGSESENKRRMVIALVLLALVFVGAMVLHKHNEPKVIGNLSKEEVSRIKTTFFEGVNYEFRIYAGRHLQARAIGPLIEDLRRYDSIKIMAIEAVSGGKVRLTVKARYPTETVKGFCYEKDNGSWTCVKVENGLVSDWLRSASNTASVSRSAWP